MHTPKLCHHKASQQGYVTLNGREVYLGHWPRDQRKAPPAVRAEYDAVIGRWLANGRRLPDPTAVAPPVTVNEIVLKFVEYANGHYAKKENGESSEVGCIKDMCRVLSEQFGRIPAVEFGPKALKLVRAKMVELDWSRTYTNHQINRLKRLFRFAVAEEMIPATVLHGLSAVPAIRRGEAGVRETEPVKPVPEEWIEAAVPFMSKQVATLVRFQIYTGARPGEAVIIRGKDIDRSGRVWTFKPEQHKGKHRGRGREVYIGPKAQAVLSLWLRDDPDAYLFAPAEVVQGIREEKRKNRKSKVQPSQTNRAKSNPKKVPGDRYTTMSYARAIKYACLRADDAMRTAAVESAKKANPDADVSEVLAAVYCPVWSPHPLRHNAGTAMRKEFGVEMAQLALGHASMAATQIYAERDREKIMSAFEKVG